MYTIVLNENQYSWTCPSGCSLAESADRAQLGSLLFPGCRGGGCGVCKVRILSGKYFLRPQSRDALGPILEEQGIALACCVEPTSDMAVSLLPKND